MIANSAGGVDLEVRFKSFLLDQISEDGLRCWTPANISFNKKIMTFNHQLTKGMRN